MDIQYISFDRVIIIHDYVIKKTGGRPGIINNGLLKSCLEHVQNDVYYPKFLDKATYLVYSINKNHCFIDGNKRSSMLILYEFLHCNRNLLPDSFSLDNYVMMEYVIILVADNILSRDDLYKVLEFILNASAKHAYVFGFIAFDIGKMLENENINKSNIRLELLGLISNKSTLDKIAKDLSL